MSAQRPAQDFRQDYQEVLEHLQAWAAFILANLLWVFVSLPLVTLPAATAGLVAVMSQWVGGSRPEPFSVFFRGFRKHGLRATLIVLTELLIAAPLVFNLLITLQADANPLLIMARGLSIGVLVTLAALNMYLWPLLVRLEEPLTHLWRTALKLLFLHPVPALLSLAACAAVVGSSLFLPKAVPLLFSVSALAFVACYGTRRVLHRFEL